MVKKKELKKLLNLNFVDLTNKTYLVGKYDLPYVSCSLTSNPDYLALYSERRNYFKTNNTWVCFYLYDTKFDTIDGIFNAIYYADERRLKKIKERFHGVKYAIAPDYSQCGDMPKIENLYRLFKSRIVSLWLLLEMDIVVIPNITYASEDYFDSMFDGIENCETVAFSVKGSVKDVEERNLLLKAIEVTTNCLTNLKKIIVYSVSIDDEKIKKLFDYPVSKGIEIVIPDNLLKERNVFLKGARQNG